MTDPVAPAVDLEELRRLAERATPGDQPGMTDADADFYTAANLATILQLLDLLQDKAVSRD